MCRYGKKEVSNAVSRVGRRKLRSNVGGIQIGVVWPTNNMQCETICSTYIDEEYSWRLG